MASPSETTVYCAGPMFSPGNLWEMDQIASTLENYGYATYLPQRDGIEMGSIMDMAKDPQNLTKEQQEMAAKLGPILMQAIFSLDVYQLLVKCDAVVFNMNGRVPDGGSVAETAAAFTSNKPILIYKDDPITLMNGLDNPMIMGLTYTWQTTSDFNLIPSTLDLLISAIEKEFGTPPKPTYNRHLQNVIAFGEAVQALLPQTNPEILIGELFKLAPQFPPWSPSPTLVPAGKPAAPAKSKK